MKRLLALLLILPMLAIAAPHDLVISQRNADDSGLAPSRRMSPPTDGSSALLAYNGGTTQLPTMWRLGAGLTLSNGVLSATPVPMAVAWGDVTGKPASYPSTLALVAGLQSALDGKLSAPTGTAGQYLRGDGTLANFPTIPAAQVRPDWNATSGLASIDNKPALAPVATAGTYASLTGVPTTFAPAAHSQAWSTITSTPTTLAGYGIQDGVSQSALSGYVTTGALASGLSAKFNTPAGTTSQYIRGDGTLATFPAAKRVEAYTGTTNASGQISVTYATPYPTAPVVQPPAPTLSNQVWTTISSTTTGFTLQLNQRNTVTLLSVEVLLGATVPVVGTTAKILVVAE